MALIHFADQAASLDEVETRGARAAWSLRDLGVTQGATIGLLLRNEPALIEALTCIRCLSAIRVLIPWHLAAEEVGRILYRVQPRVLIVHEDLLAPIATLLTRFPAMVIVVVDTHTELVRTYDLKPTNTMADPARSHRWQELIARAPGSMSIPPGAPPAISLTSGSTGVPKVIRWDGPQRWEQWYPHRTDHRPQIRTSIVTAPLFHGAQYGVFSQAWRMRANVVIEPKFDAESFLAAVERYRVNHAYLVPTMFVRLLRLPQRVRKHYDLSSLDYVFHSGAPCPVDVKRAMIEWWGPILWEAYGCSETSTLAVCSSPQWLSRPGTVGRPLRPLAILDDCGARCRVGETGQIWASVTGMPRITADDYTLVVRRIGDAEMIMTGDMGYLDKDDYLFVNGRADDLINTGRVKVYPAEIEHAILQHPQVLDCVAFGVPDEEFGQVIGARLQVSDPQHDLESELRHFLQSRISEHKIPVMMRFSCQPLRADTDKFNRRTLATDLQADHEPLAASSTVD